MWLLCVAAFVAAHGFHLVELHKRSVPKDEQHQLLQLLQEDAGSGHEQVPNIRLNVSVPHPN